MALAGCLLLAASPAIERDPPPPPAPRDVAAVIPSPVYDSEHPRHKEVLVLSRLIPDPAVPSSAVATPTATAQVWWARPTSLGSGKPRLVGLAWEPDGGVVELHGVIR